MEMEVENGGSAMCNHETGVSEGGKSGRFVGYGVREYMYGVPVFRPVLSPM